MNEIVVAIIVGVLLLHVIGYLVTVIVAGYFVYTRTLKKRSQDHWSGEKIEIVTPRIEEMDKIGSQWQKEHSQFKKDIHIQRNGFNLYGEFYDMGYEKTVIVLSGRTESRRYGYFFGRPYSSNGCNVVVLDPRAHGKSDGTYNTTGFEEGKDALAWAKHLHEEYGADSIIFHGICIGSAAGLYAITSKDCPEYITALVGEGMFKNFAESMKNHLIERKKNFPLALKSIDFWMKHYTGHSMMFGPVDVMSNMKKPLLMLHSKEDNYSVPKYAEMLYEMCPSENKKIVFFEKGAHSMLRITDNELYDKSIKEFLQSL